MDKIRFQDDEGLTLVELMISIGVLMIIIFPIISSLLLSIVESTSSRERTSDAAAAQLISTYLQNDVQSSCLRANPGNPSSACGAGTVVNAPVTPKCVTNDSTHSVKLELARNPSFDDKVVIDYVDFTDTDGEHELQRVICVNDGPPSDPVVLALNLDSAKFTCDCTSDAPDSVTIEIQADSQAGRSVASVGGSYRPFDFTFEARRRVGS